MRAVTYRRVSTKKQTADDRHSLSAQADAIGRLCIANHVGEREAFEDLGHSAWTNNIDKLPGLKALLAYIGEHRVDAVVVGADVDRIIGRKGGLQAKVFEALAEAKVKLVTPIKTFDPNDQSDYMFLRFFGVLAEAESDIRSRRVRAAKEEKAKGRGLSNIGKVVNLGFQRSPDAPGGLSVVEREAQMVRYVLETYATGAISQRGIAKAVRIHYPDIRSRNTRDDRAPITLGTIVSICRRARFYAGQVHYKGEWFPGHHDPIIPMELAERVESVPQRKGHPPKTSVTRPLKPYLFRKLIRCFGCGQRLLPDWRNGKAHYRGDARRKLRDCEVCAGRYLQERDIELDLFFVMKSLREYKLAEIDGKLDAVRPDVSSLNAKRLAALKGKRYRMTVAYADGGYQDHESEYRDELERVEIQIAALTPASKEQLNRTMRDPLWTKWLNPKSSQRLDVEELRQFFARSLEAIFVDTGDKKRPIRYIAPVPSLRLTGSERIYVGLAGVGVDEELTLDSAPPDTNNTHA